MGLTPLKASFEEGSGIRSIVPSHGKVQASKRSEGLLFAGLDLVRDDVRPEWVPVCGSELGIPGVCSQVEIIEGEAFLVPEQIENAGFESRCDFSVICSAVGWALAAHTLCKVSS